MADTMPIRECDLRPDTDRVWQYSLPSGVWLLSAVFGWKHASASGFVLRKYGNNNIINGILFAIW